MRRFATFSCGYLKNLKETNIRSRLIVTSSVAARPCLQLEWETTKESIYSHLNYGQQKRDYTPQKFDVYRECWNCKKEQKTLKVVMHCVHCGSLQDLKEDINYFEILDFSQKFDLQPQELTKRFRKLQTLVHPDKYSNKDSREQSNSADWSSLINKAYKTLLIPLERGEYLLKLSGMQMPQDNSSLDKEFLMEMMERNEQVEDAVTSSELSAINDLLAQELKEKEGTLAKSFFENNLEVSKMLLIEMKYLRSIQKTIKNKLQTLLKD